MAHNVASWAMIISVATAGKLIKASDAEAVKCEEFKFLMYKFSSGVRLKELASVGVIVAMMAEIPPPPRQAKRSFPLLIQWFRMNWNVLYPYLLLVELRDSTGCVINAQREALEMMLK